VGLELRLPPPAFVELTTQGSISKQEIEELRKQARRARARGARGRIVVPPFVQAWCTNERGERVELDFHDETGATLRLGQTGFSDALAPGRYVLDLQVSDERSERRVVDLRSDSREELFVDFGSR